MNKKILIIIIALVAMVGIYWLSTPNFIEKPENSGVNAEEEMVALPYADDVNDLPLKSRADAALGEYLTDSSGFTLYMYKKDGVQKSNCTGACAETWIPFLSYGDIKIQTYTDELTKQVNYTQRADDKNQFSFGPSPLYYYSGDKKPGDVSGHDMGNGDWSVITLQQ